MGNQLYGYVEWRNCPLCSMKHFLSLHSHIVKWYMKCFIYWTADLKSSKPLSSQLWTQFKQLRVEACKSQDFNGVWTRDLAIPVRGHDTNEVSRYREVTGSNCLNCVHNCDNHGLLHSHIVSILPWDLLISQIWNGIAGRTELLYFVHQIHCEWHSFRRHGFS